MKDELKKSVGEQTRVSDWVERKRVWMKKGDKEEV